MDIDPEERAHYDSFDLYDDCYYLAVPAGDALAKRDSITVDEIRSLDNLIWPIRASSWRHMPCLRKSSAAMKGLEHFFVLSGHAHVDAADIAWVRGFLGGGASCDVSRLQCRVGSYRGS